MKLTKLSLIAAMLIGSSAFAIENTKVSGDINLFYGTMHSDGGTYGGASTDLFDAAGAYGDISVNLELTTDLTKGVSAGAKVTYVTTLGLENNLVENTWSNTHAVTSNQAASFATRAQLDDAMYMGELWVAGTAMDTTLKVGRQSLDTPLAFTESWGVDANTFEAAVVINQSLPDTTLIGAYVGKSNGSADDLNATGHKNNTGLNSVAGYATAAQAGYMAQEGKFNTFGTNGVYVAGLINNSVEPLTVQAWYYSLQQLADAIWLQADLNVDGILLGAQYTEVDVDAGTNKDEAYSFMVGYEAKDMVTIKAAYSSVDEDGTIGVANVATGNGNSRNGAGAQSKLYTEMWWAYGSVSAIGADSWSVTAETTVAGIDLFAGYYKADIDPTGATDEEMTEIALTATKSFGPLDTSLAIILDDFEDNAASTNNYQSNNLQVYLTYNF
ncbi:hypothetical protein N9A28_09420 [Sulfurimonas sp.]|nr:hypothetical protein [Sulfurimonas sp.]